jgi:hypothetical protein
MSENNKSATGERPDTGRKSVAGRLFYTFGTIFMMAVITVCAMNFSKDARIMNRPAVTASTESTSPKQDKSSDKEQTGTKQTGTGKSNAGQTTTKKATTKQTKTGQDSTVNGSRTNKKTPANPGEEP